MTPQIQDFIETYKQKPKPAVSMYEWMKEHNHEIWRQCPKCGAYEDLRKTTHCTECHTRLEPRALKHPN